MRAGDPLSSGIVGHRQVASPAHLRTSLTNPRGFMVEQIGVCNCLYLYRRSPDSGERHYKSRIWQKRSDPGMRAGGGWSIIRAGACGAGCACAAGTC
jgi:hypothetical protein